tara:strand:- start:1935 stop:2186 length:252 start_codon:yes stop_codon:yes gene_type:complete
MPRYHNINGENVQFTPEEEIARDAEEATWVGGASARAAEAIQGKRRAAYQAEADPLFFEEQRGEVPAGTHAAKVAEIKARFPK